MGGEKKSLPAAAAESWDEPLICDDGGILVEVLFIAAGYIIAEEPKHAWHHKLNLLSS